MPTQPFQEVKMSHQTYQLMATDGVKLFAQGWMTEMTPKALILLLHGIGEHSSRYAHVGQAFNEAGFHLFTFDQRGHGRSDGRRGYTPSERQLMDDITLCLDHARSIAGEELPVFIYGHSLGGIEALYYGLTCEPTLSGFIITSPGLDLSSANKKQLFLVKLLTPIMPKLSIATGLKGQTIFTRDPAISAAGNSDPLNLSQTTLRMGKFLLDAVNTIIENANQWRYPMLIMHSSGDLVVNIQSVEQFVKAVSFPITYKRWEGLYHELHNEPEKAEVFQTIFDWIQTQI
jgi:alpha-beta hydrolase superfamily lysophospholipase